IGWGMLAVSSMALQLKALPQADAIRILELIASVGPLPRLGNLSPSQLQRILAGDKKARGGRVLWVLPCRIGKTEWGKDVPWPMVERTINALPVLGDQLFK